MSGEIPVTTDKPAQLHRPAKGKTGAYDAQDPSIRTERYKIALAVENAYMLCRLQHDLDHNASHYRDVYVETSLSLLNYVLHVRNDTALILDKILPFIAFDKLDFYFLVEPHRSSGQYLLDDALIREWWSQRQSVPCSYPEVYNSVKNLLSSNSGALVYTQRVQILDKINTIRQRLVQYASARPRGVIEEIEKSYTELTTSNNIDGLSNVLPAGTAAYFAANPGLKMIHDELRYIGHNAFKDLESMPFDGGKFHEIVNIIGECLYASTADDRVRTQKLLNKNTIKHMISPGDKIQEINMFLYSTSFLHIPMTREEADNLRQKYATSRPDPSNIVVFNIAKDTYNQHRRLLEGPVDAPANQNIVQMLMSLNVDTLDSALRDEIKRKFA